MNKYGAKRTHSQLCNRTFDSKAECVRGEELRRLEMVGEIEGLSYQTPFRLCDDPKITIKIDFLYWMHDESGVGWRVEYEDVKGVLTREFRVKLAWLAQDYGIDVKLIR